MIHTYRSHAGLSGLSPPAFLGLFKTVDLEDVDIDTGLADASPMAGLGLG